MESIQGGSSKRIHLRGSVQGGGSIKGGLNKMDAKGPSKRDASIGIYPGVHQRAFIHDGSIQDRSIKGCLSKGVYLRRVHPGGPFE